MELCFSRLLAKARKTELQSNKTTALSGEESRAERLNESPQLYRHSGSYVGTSKGMRQLCPGPGPRPQRGLISFLTEP
ncbi:hypothetical protein TNCV_2628731 [Trichonephila clavipes]|uniref:Uncharacterized protein n=1 Tax=Trichonephila clavipes TaxID=2585209 RepID=A0A8X6VK44_TRICX|nr:hypothetical protein TNCV_2628731 [Trichonephila clavipes]